MEAWAFVLSIVAILISATALGWQIRRWRWEQRHHVKVEGRSQTFVVKHGEQIPLVGVRETNNNPGYPIRVNAVAFTPADQEVPELWFDSAGDQLPAVIEPHDAGTIDIPIERISEVGDPLGSAFVGHAPAPEMDLSKQGKIPEALPSDCGSVHPRMSHTAHPRSRTATS